MDNTERIDRYLSGAMEAAEKAQFEAELATDTQLAKDLVVHRDMGQFLQQQTNRKALQEQLKAVGQDYFQPAQSPPKVVSLSRRRMLALAGIAAAAAVILLILWPFWQSPTLYEQFAVHPPLSLAEKSAGVTDWSQTEKAFAAGDYATAETQLTQYLAAHPDDRLARIYLGICKTERNKTEEARPLFTGFEDADPALRDFATWCLALNYLKAGDNAACMAILNSIKPDSSFFDRAFALRESLIGKYESE